MTSFSMCIHQLVFWIGIGVFAYAITDFFVADTFDRIIRSESRAKRATRATSLLVGFGIAVVFAYTSHGSKSPSPGYADRPYFFW